MVEGPDSVCVLLWCLGTNSVCVKMVVCDVFVEEFENGSEFLLMLDPKMDLELLLELKRKCCWFVRKNKLLIVEF